MTFLAPWIMVFGVAGAAGAVLLHLVATQRPAAYLLPTARFIPERQTLVSRAASRPRDLLLLLLRVLVLLCAGAGLAKPVFAGHRAQHARIVLLDRSAMVADAADAWRRAHALLSGDAPHLLIAFDSVARVASPDSAPPVSRATTGSLTSALAAARRAAGPLSLQSDSVELVLVSPVGAAEMDAATFPVRALWPGAITVERVAAHVDTLAPPALEKAIPLSDVLGPALAHAPVRASPSALRLVRTPSASAADSAFARGGGTVVVWDSSAAPVMAMGLAMGDDVIVAPLGRRGLTEHGRVRARWADGAPAARDEMLGAGCIRTVAVALPGAGDLPLRTGFQRIVRGLVSSCAMTASTEPADSAAMRQLAGMATLAPSSALDSAARVPSRATIWLLGAALACALLELLVRRGRPQAEDVA